MTHTPGPWRIGVAGNCNVVHFNGDDIIGVAICGEHNARLIAAAPDLYAALLGLMDYPWDQSTPAYKAALEAVRKVGTNNKGGSDEH